MSGKPISFIERNDSDQRFREKCNENFRAVSARQQISPDDIGDIALDTGLLAAKVDQVDFDNAIDILNASRLEPSDVLAGDGISVAAGSSTVTISLDASTLEPSDVLAGTGISVSAGASTVTIALDAQKLEPSDVLAGAGISVDVGASTVTISAACPFPIDALFSHVSANNPSTIWPGTTWTGPLEDSLAEATRWRRTA